MTSGRLGSPVAAANTPAVTTRLSLGTTGKKPSIAATAKSARSTHGDAIAPSTRWVMASTMAASVAGAGRPLHRGDPPSSAATGSRWRRPAARPPGPRRGSASSPGREPSTSVKPYCCASSPLESDAPVWRRRSGSAASAATARPTKRGDSEMTKCGWRSSASRHVVLGDAERVEHHLRAQPARGERDRGRAVRLEVLRLREREPDDRVLGEVVERVDAVRVAL